MEGAYGAADPVVGQANSAAQSPAPSARSSRGAVVGGAPSFSPAAGFAVGFGDAITGERSFPRTVYPSANATPGAAALPCERPVAAAVVSPGASALPDTHPGDPSLVAGSLARGEGKKRTTATEGHGEWKKLKGDPPVHDKGHHIVVDGSAPCVPGEQVVAGDIGQGQEGSEGEGEQIGAGDVEASKGEQFGAGDEEDSEDQQVGAEDEEDSEAEDESEDEEESEGASEDEEESEGDSDDEEESEGYSEDEDESEGASEDEEVSEGSCSDTATSSRKRRKDPMLEIMEGILETLKANCAASNKVMLDKFRKEELMTESIKKVMDLAVDCGAAEGSIQHFMATKLFVKAENREMFLTITTKKGRFDWLTRWCRKEGLL